MKDLERTSITAIILSGGKSSRMGQPKALLRIGNANFLEHITNKLRQAGLKSIVVVLGAHSAEIKHQANLEDCSVAVNQEYERGQLSSLQIGLNNLPEKTEAIMVVLIDHPLVKTGTYSELVNLYGKNENKIILPKYKDKRGHPLIIPRKYFNKIIQAPLEQGLKYVIHNNASNLIELNVDDEGIIQNINTIKNYEKYIKNG